MADLEAALLDECRNPGDNIADGIQQRILSQAKSRDDSALLFIGIMRLSPDLPAETETWGLDARDEIAARRVKRMLLRRLETLARAGDLEAVEAVVGEVLGNVARHTPGLADVLLERRNGEAVLHVDDRGGPFILDGDECPNVLTENGRGAFLIRALARDVSVQRTAFGNRVSVVLPVSLEQEGKRSLLDGR